MRRVEGHGVRGVLESPRGEGSRDCHLLRSALKMLDATTVNQWYSSLASDRFESRIIEEEEEDHKFYST